MQDSRSPSGDEIKTSEQLVHELAQLRRRLMDLEALEAEHKRAEAELLAQKQLFENMMAVAHATAGGTALEATLQSALNAAIALTGADYGDLFLLDAAGAVTFCILPPYPLTPERRQDMIAHMMDEGLVGWVARHRQAALIADTAQDERWLVLPDPQGAFGTNLYNVRSALSVPMMSGPARVGVVTLTHTHPHHFTAEHLHLLQGAADQIALAVRSAQVSQEQRRMADRQITLYEILRTVSGQLDPEAVARLAVDAIGKFAGWPQAAIVVPHENGVNWVVLAASGYLGVISGIMRLVDRGIVGRAFRLARSQYVPDVSADPDYLREHPATRSELAVPLRRGEHVLGVLNVESDQLAAFNSDDVFLAESLADAIALALENARFYTQAQQHAANLSALYAITRTTSRSLALEDVLEQALSSAVALLGFGAGMIVLADPDNGRLQLAAWRGLPLTLVERFRREALESTLAAYVHRRRESLVIRDISIESPVGVNGLAEMAAQGWRAHAGIPLLHQDQSLGAMWLFAREMRLSSSYDLALLTTIGQQVATAVANARLFQATLGQRSRLQALIKSSRDGIVFSGMDGSIQVINAPVLQLLHVPGDPEEWLGRTLKDVLAVLRIFAPGVVRVALAELRRMRKGDPSPGEGEAQAPPYVIRWLNLPVLVGNLPQGRLVMLRDVTGEREVERLRDDMTHTMVHDLRNPLGSILASLDMLTDGVLGALSPDQREVVDLAEVSASRMMDLVNAILDVSRLESGRMPLAQRAFDLAALVAEAFRVQAALAGVKNIRLESDVSSTLSPFRGTLPLAWADPGIIGRVLQNLVGNAIKFTPAGGVIRVAARLEERVERLVILVTISDTGPGIPAEIQGRLFQKFVTGRQERRGSGLGLAFCKLAVEAHGERIWVESTPGHGAAFTFSLAVDRGDAESP